MESDYRRQEEFGVPYNEYGREYLNNQNVNFKDNQELLNKAYNIDTEDITKLKRNTTRSSITPPGIIFFHFNY